MYISILRLMTSILYLQARAKLRSIISQSSSAFHYWIVTLNCDQVQMKRINNLPVTMWLRWGCFWIHSRNIWIVCSRIFSVSPMALRAFWMIFSSRLETESSEDIVQHQEAKNQLSTTEENPMLEMRLWGTNKSRMFTFTFGIVDRPISSLFIYDETICPEGQYYVEHCRT